MDVNSGSLMQLFANASYISQIRENQYISMPNNISVAHEMYYFINSVLTIPRNSDKILPEYLILELLNTDTPLDVIYNYLCNVTLVLNIGVQILEIPLSLLWNLNYPEIINNKLYLHLPFEIFSDKIVLPRINNNSVFFNIRNFSNLANYASNISLLYKSYTYGDRNYLYDSSFNIIQQISSIELKVSLHELNEVSREFVLDIKNFKGFTKGFLIESQNIEDMEELQIFINGYIRTNYDKFLIRNKCVKINENMLYYPFNSDKSYIERCCNSFEGSISLDQIARANLRLKFTNSRNKVKIYGINMNDFRTIQGQRRLIHNTNNFHVVQDFNSHPLLSFNELVSSPLSMTEPNNSSNVIPNSVTVTPNNIIADYNNYTNYINNTINYTIDYIGYTGMTGSARSIYTGMSGAAINYYNHYYTNDNSGNYLNNNLENSIYENSVNELPVGETIIQLVTDDKRICGISWDEIQENDRYMTCSFCNNNFKEIDIKHWLEQRRNCPSCRGEWNNYNIYINSNI